MESIPVNFYSDGIRLSGLIRQPDDLQQGEKRAGIVFVSGFGGIKEWVPGWISPPFVEAGYVTLSYDERGFGESESRHGPDHGRVIPAEFVRDVRDAVTFLSTRDNVDPDRIAVVGWAFGGGIVIQTGAEDPRIQAVVCLNGVGDGARQARDAGMYDDWLNLQDRIAEDRKQRVLTGQSDRIHWWQVLYPGSRQDGVEVFDTYARGFNVTMREFTLQTAEAYYEFKPERVVDQISPRPLLLVHGARDTYNSLDEAQSIYEKAKEPKELIVLPTASHAQWNEPDNPLFAPTFARIVNWITGHLPPKTAAE